MFYGLLETYTILHWSKKYLGGVLGQGEATKQKISQLSSAQDSKSTITVSWKGKFYIMCWAETVCCQPVTFPVWSCSRRRQLCRGLGWWVGRTHGSEEWSDKGHTEFCYKRLLAKNLLIPSANRNPVRDFSEEARQDGALERGVVLDLLGSRCIDGV